MVYLVREAKIGERSGYRQVKRTIVVEVRLRKPSRCLGAVSLTEQNVFVRPRGPFVEFHDHPHKGSEELEGV